MGVSIASPQALSEARISSCLKCADMSGSVLLPADTWMCETTRVTDKSPSAASAQRMNVESFNLDHRTVVAPYIRLADHKTLPQGDTLSKFDIRFTQPNRAHLEMPAIHSLEHLFAEKSRNHSTNVVDFSPMGCQTGFYLLLSGDWDIEAVAALVEATMKDILHADEVPAANEVQCGWGANHSLPGAQEAARTFLAARDQWLTVTA
ncbi:S-ribosylhomocysteine lyase /quorum-sensing autoinducer 2 (AI-2) synthesis protein LuxS [Micrococcales bacterium KH10]|nr:S-ribosylhomocysteine lyase /quorum-sensing autoinducer 2 (AI-2) synthesis protein LuxS [Micrococcales bacterium KH10]